MESGKLYFVFPTHPAEPSEGFFSRIFLLAPWLDSGRYPRSSFLGGPGPMERGQVLLQLRLFYGQHCEETLRRDI